MTVIRSDHLDAARHLALEEALLGEVQRFAPALFLWRSSSGVVIGKNQNPWRECRTDRLKEDGAALTRRVSGGGTVYHDDGNLNFTLLLRRAAYDEAAQFDVIRRALRSLGIEAALMNRNSLAVDGRKISGNAFCFRRDAALHHGTLLVNTDLERLHRYLGDLPGGFETHAIASVPATVANLSDFSPGLDWLDVARALETAFRETLGDHSPTLDAGALMLEGLAELEERHASAAWRLGRTPRFTVRLEHADRAGELVLTVEGGRVTDAQVEHMQSSDAVTGALVGGRFGADELAGRLDRADVANGRAAQVQAALKAHVFRWLP